MQLNQQCQCLLDCSSIISYPIFSLCLLNSRRQTSYFCILAYIRIVHFFQDLFCHVILVEEQVLLNGNIASPKSTLRFHCEVTCFILKKQESTLYNEGISFRHQDPGERGLDLLFLGKIKTFLNKKWNVLTVLGKEKKKKNIKHGMNFSIFFSWTQAAFCSEPAYSLQIWTSCIQNFILYECRASMAWYSKPNHSLSLLGMIAHGSSTLVVSLWREEWCLNAPDPGYLSQPAMGRSQISLSSWQGKSVLKRLCTPWGSVCLIGQSCLLISRSALLPLTPPGHFVSHGPGVGNQQAWWVVLILPIFCIEVARLMCSLLLTREQCCSTFTLLIVSYSYQNEALFS